MDDDAVRSAAQDDRADTSITLGERAGAAVVVVRGELDYASAPRLRAAILEVLGRGGDRPVVLDLTGVEFLGSAGLAGLVQCAELARQETARCRALRVVVDRTRPVIRPIQIAGLDRLLALYHDIDEAVRDASVAAPS